MIDASGHYGGNGVQIEGDPVRKLGAKGTLRSVVIDDSAGYGLGVVVAEVTADRLAVRRVGADAAGDFGDGVTVIDYGIGPPVDLSLTSSVVSSCTRAGVSSFQSPVTISASAFVDDGVDLDAEGTGVFHDLGANVCRTGGTPHTCQVLSSALKPPAALQTR